MSCLIWSELVEFGELGELERVGKVGVSRVSWGNLVELG